MALGASCDLRAREYFQPFTRFERPGANSRSSNVPGSERAPQVSPVFNCGDSGPGSLRSAVETAASGDTIDMSQLVCSRISLTTGETDVRVDSLTLLGRTDGQLVIDGSALKGMNFGLIEHVGFGTLSLYELTLMYGEALFQGGCINSWGNVYLYNTAVAGCIVRPDASSLPGGGGGVAAYGFVAMQGSVVSGNILYSTLGQARGGGVFAGSGLLMRESRIDHNQALSYTELGLAGGAFVRSGGAYIAYSTIDDNIAGGTTAPGRQYPGNAGALLIATYGSPFPSTIINSTISQNLAFNVIGGIYTDASISIYNSTVAFNEAYSNGSAAGYYAGGLHVYLGTAYLFSSIIAENTALGAYLDLTTNLGTVSGAYNLIMASTVSPPGTLAVDPQLGPLGDYGGPTPTNPLVSTSPAINRGRDIGEQYDQRGPGFPRIVGASSDIGAFEFSSTDLIFVDGFDL